MQTVVVIDKCCIYFHKVCSVLDSLEREYRRDEDWCSSDKSGTLDKATLISQLINKHQEQKEAFLKVDNVSFEISYENNPIYVPIIYYPVFPGLYFSQKNGRDFPKICVAQSSVL